MPGSPRHTHTHGAKSPSLRDTIRTKVVEVSIAKVQDGNADRKTLCMEMLTSGNPAAFVDFFYLSHADLAEQPPAEVLAEMDPAEANVHAQRAKPMNTDALNLLASLLVEAEAFQRKGDTEGVYASYSKIARYFAGLGDYETGSYFYHKCLLVASTAGWAAGEIDANLNLGLTSERLHRADDAMMFHKRHQELARAHGSDEDRREADRNLMKSYSGLADDALAHGDLAGAEECLEKMMQAARDAGMREAEADGHLRLGKVHLKAGRFKPALKALKAYLTLERTLNDLYGQGQAQFMLAVCLEKAGKRNEAAICLQEYRRLALEAAEKQESGRSPQRASTMGSAIESDVSSQAGDEDVQVAMDQGGFAVASCKLGEMAFEQGEYSKAVGYFKEFFDAARRVGDMRMLNAARVNLGQARALLLRGKFLEVVRDDMPKLLSYKLSREPLQPAQKA
ncbi:unnamed protein product [Pedinophyceae sp. YPF-701]|nr:unnamed protein product [Pedinophyceae sp. YPF-701]